MVLSRLFHSITLYGKDEFLKKTVFNIELRNISNISRSICSPNGGNIIEQMLKRSEKIEKFSIPSLLL